MQFLSVHLLNAEQAKCVTIVLPQSALTADAEVHRRLFERLGDAVAQLPQLRRLGPPLNALDLVIYPEAAVATLARELPDALTRVQGDDELVHLLQSLAGICAEAQRLGQVLVCTGD